MRGRAFVFCLGLVAAARAASPVSTPISTIDIQSDWGGLGNAQSTTVHIARDGDRYSANGAPVSAQAVAYLLAALHEPDIGSPMHAIGKDDLAAAVAKQRDRVAVLSGGDTFDETAWIVRPDHRLVLWHYAGKTGHLEWTPKDFSAKHCKGTSFYDDGGCVGAIVSPQGEIVDRGAATERRAPSKI
ncbi:MAG TPA: hypothetical protein VGF56_13495 [Rhizomicrobium sp.]